MRLVPYHTRLAWKSLRRDPGLSATIVIVLAVAAAIFSTALIHYLRLYGPRPALSPALHQVEIGVDDRALRLGFAESAAAPTRLASGTRVSFPHYRVLASSGIPARQTASFRARLWVGGGASHSPGRARNARFVNRDFFTMFALPLRWGAVWSREDEAAGRPRVVVGRQLNDELFDGADSTGQTVQIDGRPYVVAGVQPADQPFNVDWDPAASGAGQDAIYLPFAEHERLQAWPETPLYQTPTGPRHADLLASDAVFVGFWAELPTAGSRRAYQRFLDDRFRGTGVRFRLRDLAAHRAMIRFPPSAISFFTMLTLIMLAGSGLIVARLLMAKGLVRSDELGVYRALGAPRGALFWRQIIEAGMLSTLGATLATLIAVPQAALYNRFVRDTDIPLRLTGLAVSLIFVATLSVGIGAALYPSWMTARRRPTLTLGRA